MLRRLPVVALLLLLALSGCRSRPDLPPIVAHRGASHAAPENTLAAFDLAWKVGADMIEGDFRLTKDGAIVCHHDETTERTAGVDLPVEAQTLAELKRLDVGSWKGPEWEGQRIPTLQQVLATVPYGRAVLIEIKSDERIVPALARVVESSHLRRSQMIVISFDEDVVAAVKARLPDITAYWVSGFEEDGAGGWAPTLEAVLETAARCRADGVDLNAKLEVIDEAFVAAIRSADLEFHAWTINDPEVGRRLVELGVDSLTTDRPDWLRGELEEGIRGSTP